MNRIMLNTEAIESVQGMANAAQLMYNPEIIQAFEPLTRMQTIINQNLTLSLEPIITQFQNISDSINTILAPYEQIYANIADNFSAFANIAEAISFPILNIYHDDISTEEKSEISETNEKIVSEILQSDQEKNIDIEDSPIIILSPVNDRVLKYLSENPELFYKLSDSDFEIVMLEIYTKLGYDVTRTQATRDGGKDLIIRKPEILGDFIYYVECKKYAAKRHIGVGIVRSLVGTVNTDRVNGGILATTSFFTKDARKFIMDNKLNCQIKMHDYDMIKDLLNKVV